MLKGHLNWGPCPDIHVVNGESWPYPIGSMVLLYMVTFTINIPQMLAYIYISYMDTMGMLAILNRVESWKYCDFFGCPRQIHVPAFVT